MLGFQFGLHTCKFLRMAESLSRTAASTAAVTSTCTVSWTVRNSSAWCRSISSRARAASSSTAWHGLGHGLLLALLGGMGHPGEFVLVLRLCLLSDPVDQLRQLCLGLLLSLSH